jgi:hypothetical protein
MKKENLPAEVILLVDRWRIPFKKLEDTFGKKGRSRNS